MKLVPYDRPIVADYQSRAFQAACTGWAPRIGNALSESKSFVRERGEPWIRHPAHEGRPSGRSQPWTLKVYVCVSASRYWPLVMRLIDRFAAEPVAWKIYLAPEGYQRPDKIVFYPRTRAELVSLIGALRREMPKSGFHEIRHAALTEAFGIEPTGQRGLYVGLDPAFLQVTWRLYRCVCAAWEERNQAYIETLPGGRARWFSRMNLSTEHEGPAILQPSIDHLGYVRRYWKLIAC